MAAATTKISFNGRTYTVPLQVVTGIKHLLEPYVASSEPLPVEQKAAPEPEKTDKKGMFGKGKKK